MDARTITRQLPTLRTAIAAISLAVGGVACASLQYAQTVDRFEAANQVATDPYAGEAAKAKAEAGFKQVIQDLDDAYISTLKSPNQPDALVMRAYSEWQLGLYDDARINARRAQVAPDVLPGSHADVTSHVLTGLITASMEIQRWNNSKRAVGARGYPAYEANFVEAMARVSEASKRIADDTPFETVAFTQYARWRVASDWRWVLQSYIGKRGARLTGPQREAIRSMREVLGTRAGGRDLAAPVAELLLAIPSESPLRALAEAESKQPPERRV
jgi:hypothetical protein